MKKIQVTITEKDKKGKDLSLLNIRDEIVNFLYKDTIASSTRVDMQFYVLFFFISLQSNNKTLLEIILDAGIPKLEKLNTALSNKKGYLRKGEYKKMVAEYGLVELFENDLFFIIIQGILNIKEIEEQFKDFFQKYPSVGGKVKEIGNIYYKKLEQDFEDFKQSRIEDDRHDEYGNYYDLSKSIYRTIKMRSSRNLDLNLQRYTSIKKITSESPIDLTFLQQIDPQIIFDIWDKLHLAQYLKSVWNVANNSPIISGTISGVVGGLVIKFFDWKKIDGAKDKKNKNKARQDFEKSRRENNTMIDELTLKLADSVLRANERLEKELDNNREQYRDLVNQNVLIKDKKRIQKLEKRIVQLENLVVKADLIEDK